MMNGKSKGYRPLRGLDALWCAVPGFASLTPGFTPPSAPRTR